MPHDPRWSRLDIFSRSVIKKTTHQKDKLDKRSGFGLRFNATELCKVNKGRAGLTSFS
jgi:hypothetical protein